MYSGKRNLSCFVVYASALNKALMSIKPLQKQIGLIKVSSYGLKQNKTRTKSGLNGTNLRRPKYNYPRTKSDLTQYFQLGLKQQISKQDIDKTTTIRSLPELEHHQSCSFFPFLSACTFLLSSFSFPPVADTEPACSFLWTPAVTHRCVSKYTKPTV